MTAPRHFVISGLTGEGTRELVFAIKEYLDVLRAAEKKARLEAEEAERAAKLARAAAAGAAPVAAIQTLVADDAPAADAGADSAE
ncbi:hypothetical protein D3C84_1221930 [compost metagenome]